MTGDGDAAASRTETVPVRAVGVGWLGAIDGSDCATLFGSLLKIGREALEIPNFSRTELRYCK
jgi:hypothetical protein